jgi:hypothetical protein
LTVGPSMRKSHLQSTASSLFQQADT